MPMYLRRRRREGDENPTWPGLVDLFAFGMAIMIVMNVIVAKKLGEKNASDPESVKRRQLEELRSMKESLIRDNEGIATDLEYEEKRFRIRIDTVDGRPILFESGQWQIARPDSIRLQQLFAAIAREMKKRPVVELRINGTADPERISDNNRCLEDNFELSALRAAAVARVMNANEEKIAHDRVRIVGLGEEGEMIVGSTPQERARQYEKYRTVRLELYIDAARVAAQVAGQ